MIGIVLALASSTSVRAESLKSALGSAYNHNSELNAQRAATRVADEQLPQVKAGYRPTVTGDANWGFVRTTTNSFGGSTSSTNPYGYGITINQNIFNGFRTVNGIAAAEARIRGSREQLRNIEQNVLQSAATAYVNVLVAQEQLSIRRRNLSFLSEQLRSSNARLDVGEGTRTDVAQSQAQRAAALATVSAAQAQLEGAKAVYFQLIGRRPSNLRWPSGPTNLYPGSLNSALSTGINQHPAIRLAMHSVDASAFNVKVQEGAFLPTLSLQGNANKSFNRSSQGSRDSSVSARLNLSVPIYQGGLASSKVRESKEGLAQSRIQVDVARDQVRAAIINAWSQLSSSRANVSANRQQVKASRLALSGVVEERNVGQRTQLDVLNQQSQLLTAQLSLLTARKGQVDAGYALAAAIGRLNSRNLRLTVRHYQPKKHYRAVKDLWFGLRTPSGR
ncbi:MAG: TolC family outer membrane protein [Rhizobiaceae bacterium]